MKSELKGNIKSSIRSRGWILIWNNYTESDYLEVLNYLKTMTQYILGKEIAPTTGTPHLQGFFYNENAIYLSALNNRFPKAVWLKAKGNEQHNLKYCSKEGHYETNIKDKSIKIINNHIVTGKQIGRAHV